jgi:hypothetical protein
MSQAVDLATGVLGVTYNPQLHRCSTASKLDMSVFKQKKMDSWTNKGVTVSRLLPPLLAVRLQASDPPVVPRVQVATDNLSYFVLPRNQVWMRHSSPTNAF